MTLQAGRRLAVRLHAGAERAVRRGHPWIYAEGIRQLKGAGTPGDLAVVFDQYNRFLAVGLFDPDSPIRIRVLHHGEPVTIDGAWLTDRIRSARLQRRGVAGDHTTGYRLVHGENDALPGLVVDRYNDNAVVKLYSAAWLPHLEAILDALHAVDQPARTVLRLSRAVQAATDAFSDGQVLTGDLLGGPVLFRENGITFEADLQRGQKTGFFLDQRDNRARVERLARGRSVLNVFAYTGGFSVYAARGGAPAVTSVDISAPALDAAQRNFDHNRDDPNVRAARHHRVVGDAFDVIPRMARDGQRFDMVILDPPSFAKASAEVDRALASYVRIVRLGLDVLDRNGILVAASCSSRITADAFHDTVLDAAALSRRRLRILQQTGHAPDHPIGFAEGAYLKCIFAESG